ncbi:hypothetical protein [Prosthecobacter sp.]|uniref:hypothetical protein n=1 Tax=Prosthecobacter sp. TaxID=1965333 RepID=UPI0037852E8D
MNPESDLNPYAAPQSDGVPLRAGEQEPSVPRPASTKWLLGLMWFFLICGVFMGFLEEGLAFFRAFVSIQVALRFSGMLLIMIAFQVFRRSLITYVLGIVCLVFLGYVLAKVTSATVHNLADARDGTVDKTQIRADLFVALVFSALFAKLCYHFIFGLPSRRFYRLTSK